MTRKQRSEILRLYGLVRAQMGRIMALSDLVQHRGENLSKEMHGNQLKQKGLEWALAYSLENAGVSCQVARHDPVSVAESLLLGIRKGILQ